MHSMLLARTPQEARRATGSSRAWSLTSGPTARRPPSARRLSLMGDERNPSAREARRASLAAQTPEDAIDNERLVSALAQDLLGEPPMAAQLAEVYGAHSRALLEA